jgi:hypothetical protein
MEVAHLKHVLVDPTDILAYGWMGPKCAESEDKISQSNSNMVWRENTVYASYTYSR